jgi:hypothetical protein
MSSFYLSSFVAALANFPFPKASSIVCFLFISYSILSYSLTTIVTSLDASCISLGRFFLQYLIMNSHYSNSSTYGCTSNAYTVSSSHLFYSLSYYYHYSYSLFFLFSNLFLSSSNFFFFSSILFCRSYSHYLFS